jgi:hypothetical protein
MTKGTWARSGARPSTGRGVRPAGSWAASVARARASFDGLVGVELVRYSAESAAAILACAATLWADTAAGMGDEDGDDA